MCSSVPRYSGLRVLRYGPSASIASPCIDREFTTLAPTYDAPHTRSHAPSATSTIAAISTAFVAATNDNHPVRDSHDDSTSHVRSRVHPSASHHGAQNPSMMITACRIHRNLYSSAVAFINSQLPNSKLETQRNAFLFVIPAGRSAFAFAVVFALFTIHYSLPTALSLSTLAGAASSL